jgi:hypothetical protein
LFSKEGNPGVVYVKPFGLQTAPFGLYIVWVEISLPGVADEDEELELVAGSACPSLLFSSSCKVSFSY